MFGDYSRLLSCRDLCSDRLKARLQNWHLYLFSFSFSGPLVEALRLVEGDPDATGAGCASAPATADMLARWLWYGCGELCWKAQTGQRSKGLNLEVDGDGSYGRLHSEHVADRGGLARGGERCVCLCVRVCEGAMASLR